MALTLTRRHGESIHLFIGDDEVIIRVDKGKSSNTVLVDIEAPKHIEIMREELLDYPSLITPTQIRSK